MKLRKASFDNAETARRPEKKRFPRLRGLVERSRRAAVVLLTVAFVYGCGNGDTTTDGGNGGQDAMADAADSAVDSGRDADAPLSLCSLYGEGHENRATFSLNESRGTEGSEWRLMLRQILIAGDAAYVTFAYFPESLTSSDFLSFTVGEQITRNVTGLGTVTFELCSTTPNECAGYSDPPTGDPNCQATLASDRRWTD